MTAFLVGSGLYASVDVSLFSSGFLGSKFSKKFEDSEGITWQAGEWRFGARVFGFGYVDTLRLDSFGLYFMEIRVGKAFFLSPALVAPWVSAAYTLYESNWMDPWAGVYPYPLTANGVSYVAGVDVLWRPRGWSATLMATTRYRYIPRWFPGTLHHQWELGLGLEFEVFSKKGEL